MLHEPGTNNPPFKFLGAMQARLKSPRNNRFRQPAAIHNLWRSRRHLQHLHRRGRHLLHHASNTINTNRSGSRPAAGCVQASKHEEAWRRVRVLQGSRHSAHQQGGSSSSPMDVMMWCGVIPASLRGPAHQKSLSGVSLCLSKR